MKSMGVLLIEQPQHGLFRSSLVSALIALVGSVTVLATAYGIALAIGEAPDPNTSPAMPITALQLFGVTLFAPIVETAALAATITGLSALIRSKVWIAVLSALVWGGLHALVSPFWFFGTVWSFFVFACVYMNWRPRSLRLGFAAAAIPHALVNAVVFTVVALSPSA